MTQDDALQSTTEDELSRRDELAGLLVRLVILRWVVIFGVCVAIHVASDQRLLVSGWPLVAVTGTLAVFNLGFYNLHKRFAPRTLRALSSEALLQIGMDVVGLGLLIFFSGGLSNPFVFYLMFHIVIAAILLNKKQVYGVALLTIGVVMLLGLTEGLDTVSMQQLQGALSAPERSVLTRGGLVFAMGTTLVISVYFVTTHMDRLRSRSRDILRLNSGLNKRFEMLALSERKLAVEHQRASAILECMNDGIVLVDLQGRVLFANTAAQQSALPTLEDTLQKAGCRNETVTVQPCHETSTMPVLPTTQTECVFANPALCLQETLARGGILCPTTLALLGADPPSPIQTTCLTPPKSPVLTQIEFQGNHYENTVNAVTMKGNPDSTVAGGNVKTSETVGLVVVSRILDCFET